MITLDGSFGEGGGQILRSAVTMSMLSGRPFNIKKIRAGRSKPGLRPQHLAAIRAAAAIAGAEVSGDEVNSTKLSFTPGKITPGEYEFKVNTAGAMTLVFQTVFLPLALAGKPSRVDFRGGTHVPWSPPYEYLAQVWASLVHRMGLNIEFEIHQAGYYPVGGGWFTAHISPLQAFAPLELRTRAALTDLQATVVLSELPDHIADRELETLATSLKRLDLGCPLQDKVTRYPSRRPGNMVFLKASFGGYAAGFSSLGERGVKAETVARDVVRQFEKFYGQDAPIDEYLADQLLLPLTFATGNSHYEVAVVSRHLLTNAHVIKLFADVEIEVTGSEGKPGSVTVRPR